MAQGGRRPAITNFLSGPVLLKAGVAQRLAARAEADALHILCASRCWYVVVDLTILLVGGMVIF